MHRSRRPLLKLFVLHHTASQCCLLHNSGSQNADCDAVQEDASVLLQTFSSVHHPKSRIGKVLANDTSVDHPPHAGKLNASADDMAHAHVNLTIVEAGVRKSSADDMAHTRFNLTLVEAGMRKSSAEDMAHAHINLTLHEAQVRKPHDAGLDGWGLFAAIPAFLVWLVKYKFSTWRPLCAVVCVVIGDFLILFTRVAIADYIWAVLVVGIILYAVVVEFLKAYQHEEEGGPTFTAKDIYCDLSSSFEKCVLVFAVQSILVQFYCNAAAEEIAHVANFKFQEDWRFFTASVIVQLFVLNASEDTFPLDVWKRLLKSHGAVRMVGSEGSQAENIVKVSVSELLARFFMSLMVKQIYAKLMICTLPFVLTHEDSGLDFVKDAFAVTFVYTLDDADGPELEEVESENAPGQWPLYLFRRRAVTSGPISHPYA